MYGWTPLRQVLADVEVCVVASTSIWLHICPLGRMLSVPFLCDLKVVFSSWQLRGPWRRRWMPLHATMTLGLTMALRFISPAEFILHILFKNQFLWECRGLLCSSKRYALCTRTWKKWENVCPNRKSHLCISASDCCLDTSFPFCWIC